MINTHCTVPFLQTLLLFFEFWQRNQIHTWKHCLYFSWPQLLHSFALRCCQLEALFNIIFYKVSSFTWVYIYVRPHRRIYLLTAQPIFFCSFFLDQSKHFHFLFLHFVWVWVGMGLEFSALVSLDPLGWKVKIDGRWIWLWALGFSFTH